VNCGKSNKSLAPLFEPIKIADLTEPDLSHQQSLDVMPYRSNKFSLGAFPSQKATNSGHRPAKSLLQGRTASDLTRFEDVDLALAPMHREPSRKGKGGKHDREAVSGADGAQSRIQHAGQWGQSVY
jgi:hypothetical protein